MTQLEFQFLKARDHREAKHFWQDNEVIDIFVERLGLEPQALALYVFLTRRANNFSGETRTSTRRIASKLKMSKSAVSRWTQRLRDLGLIAVRFPTDRSGLTVYTITDVKAMLQEQRESESRVPQVGQSENFSRPTGGTRCPTGGTLCPTGGTVIKDVKTLGFKTKDGKKKGPLVPQSCATRRQTQEKLAIANIANVGVASSSETGNALSGRRETPSPTPSSSPEPRQLTPRELKRLNEELQFLEKGNQDHSHERFLFLLETACARTLIPFDSAKLAVLKAWPALGEK